MFTPRRLFLQVAVLMAMFPLALSAQSREYRGDPPTPRQIEKAYKACFKQIDDDLIGLDANEFRKREHRKAEEAACSKARRVCLDDPKTGDCRGFVEDYYRPSTET